MEIHERLNVFYARLQAAPPSASAQEALALVCRLIEEVEDERCHVPHEEPPPLRFTGRMYAPQEDRIHRSPDGSIRAETRGHTMFFSPSGAIRIQRVRDNVVEFSKPGLIL